MIILFQGVCVVALQSTFTFYQTKVDWRSSSTYDDDDEGEIQLNSMIITIMEKMRIHVFIFQLSIDRDRSLSFVRLSGSENKLAKQQHKLPSNQPSNLPIVKATGRKNSNENFESSSHTHTERKREQQKEKNSSQWTTNENKDVKLWKHEQHTHTQKLTFIFFFFDMSRKVAVVFDEPKMNWKVERWPGHTRRMAKCVYWRNGPILISKSRYIFWPTTTTTTNANLTIMTMMMMKPNSMNTTHSMESCSIVCCLQNSRNSIENGP